MTSVVVNPIRVTARLDAPLSRWLWLVKWLLVLPHLIVLSFLWIAFGVLSVMAFVAILVSGRYPHSIFAFNVGVLRWTWRVAYYTYGALGTDRYPPFTLAEVPDYPALLDVAYSEHLSRGLVLVKWWLLALPHYLVIAFFVGGGTYAAARAGDWTSASWSSGSWPMSGGLIGLLALIAGVSLLVTGRYPRGVFDLLLGMHRWVLRVAAYAALMTDAYPPFRLDLGGAEPAALAVASAGTQPGGVASTAVEAATPVSPTPPPSSWTPARIVTVVIGSLLLVASIAAAVGATVLLVTDRAGRDADGYLSTTTQRFTSSGYALVLDPVLLRQGTAAPDLGSVVGDVRIRVQSSEPGGAFVGIGPATDVDAYRADVDRERLIRLELGGRALQQRIPGVAPVGLPAQQAFWAASASGPGSQQLVWTPTEGNWTVVMMNADAGQPVVADFSAGITAPALSWLWTGLYIGAGLGLLFGALLVALAVPRSRR